MREPGTRVIAIRDTKEKTAYIYGRGVYVGNEVPPVEVCEALHNAGARNPRIDLDNGGTVWGFQCWWGGEQQVEEKFKDFEFVEVPLTTE